jgi:GTP pyrophosphokinase
MPKFNLYQSLHTTVIGPQGKPVEVQIRSLDMHQRAEFGVAAHWNYKDDHGSTADLAWLNRIVDWQSETSDPGQFMANLKIDLEQDEVFAFTPKGKVVSLTVGATPVDFAYAIHTEVGHACIGAKVNGRLAPLDTVLQSGDTVEVLTTKGAGAGPSQDWLGFVASHRAASKIKQWYSRERREDARDAGADELMKALRRKGLPVQELARGAVLDDVARAMNYVDLDALRTAIGEHHVSGSSVADRVRRELTHGSADQEERLPVTLREAEGGRGRRRRAHSEVGVHVEGLDDVMVRLSRCCTPVPGDAIIGFVTRGRGVSVHRADCANARSLSSNQSDRVIDVEWDDAAEGTFVASIEVKALDRSRLLRDVSTAMADARVNIIGCNTITGDDRISTMRFDFELADPSHLESVLRSVKQIDSIYDAYRVLPGNGR